MSFWSKQILVALGALMALVVLVVLAALAAATNHFLSVWEFNLFNNLAATNHFFRLWQQRTHFFCLGSWRALATSHLFSNLAATNHFLSV